MTDIDPDMRGAAEALVSGIERRIKDETERLRAKAGVAMEDIVDELRKQARGIIPTTLELQTKAADEIERLRKIEVAYNAVVRGYSENVGKSATANEEQGK